MKKIRGEVMKNNMPQVYIGTNTVVFAQSAIRTLEDMTGIAAVMNKGTFKERPFSTVLNMTVYIHFAGFIQGDYAISMNEATAAGLIDAYEDGMTDEELLEMREDYTGFVKEYLNTAVGLSITELEQVFGALTYSSSIVVYGKIEFPDVTSGSVVLESRAGDIQCAFSINFAKLKIGQKLEECMELVEQVNRKLNLVKREVDTILQLVPTCLVAVNAQGSILPGHSRHASEVLGYEADYIIVGLHLSDFLSLESDDRQSMDRFFELLRERSCMTYESFPFQELQWMCDGQVMGQNGKHYRLDWLPVISEENSCMKKLIITVEDITNLRPAPEQNGPAAGSCEPVLKEGDM